MVKQENAQAQAQPEVQPEPSRRSLSLSPARVHPSDTTGTLPLAGDGQDASGFQVITTDADTRPPQAASEPVAPAMEASVGTADSGGTETATVTLGSGQGSGGDAGTTSSTDTVPVTSRTVVAPVAPPPTDGELESAPPVTSPVGAYARAVSAAVGEVVMKVRGFTELEPRPVGDR